MWTTVFTDETENASSGAQSITQTSENKDFEQFNSLKNEYDYLAIDDNSFQLNKIDLENENDNKELINADTVRGCWEIQEPLQLNVFKKYNYQHYNQTKKGFLFIY